MFSSGSLLFFLLHFFSCQNVQPDQKMKNPGYDFSKPDQTLILPDTLHEISGLTMLDHSTVGCVQDENGIVFIYDVVNNQIKKQLSFHLDGDYEGIARVGKTLYVLRSDGNLFEISDYEAPDFKLNVFVTGIPVSNNEGLCFDEANKRLLIGCKSKPGKGPEFKNQRVVYGFDLQTKELSKKPVFDFNIKTIRKFAAENGIQLPVKTKKDGESNESVIKFSTSAVAIHPITGKLFLLSSTDPLLFVFDMEGNIEYMELLDPKMFNKAEGITFFQNGDLLISNEGQNKKPTLLRFNYKL